MDKNYTENTIYNKLLSDKPEAGLGYVCENVAWQVTDRNPVFGMITSETSKQAYYGGRSLRSRLQSV